MTRSEAMRLFRTLNMMMREVAMEKARAVVLQHDNPRAKPDTTGPGSKPLNDFLRKRRSRA